MKTPMAVMGMTCVEIAGPKEIATSNWTWKPAVSDATRLNDSRMSTNQTSKQTFSSQMDHGENK